LPIFSSSCRHIIKQNIGSPEVNEHFWRRAPGNLASAVSLGRGFPVRTRGARERKMRETYAPDPAEVSAILADHMTGYERKPHARSLDKPGVGL